MDILKISAAAFIVITLSAVLKQVKPEIAIQLVLISAVIMITIVFTYSKTVYEYLTELCNQNGINIQYVKILFKIIVTSYIAEFTASLCRDSGESAVAVNVETVAKFMIVTSSLPVLKELFSVLSEMAIG